MDPLGRDKQLVEHTYSNSYSWNQLPETLVPLIPKYPPDEIQKGFHDKMAEQLRGIDVLMSIYRTSDGGGDVADLTTPHPYNFAYSGAARKGKTMSGKAMSSLDETYDEISLGIGGWKYADHTWTCSTKDRLTQLRDMRETACKLVGQLVDALNGSILNKPPTYIEHLEDLKIATAEDTNNRRDAVVNVFSHVQATNGELSRMVEAAWRCGVLHNQLAKKLIEHFAPVGKKADGQNCPVYHDTNIAIGPEGFDPNSPASPPRC